MAGRVPWGDAVLGAVLELEAGVVFGGALAAAPVG